MKPYLPVSVVIPCYNNEKTIERALKSVQSQNKLPSEIIVIDDSSNDRSIQAIINIFESIDVPTKKLICHPSNKGPASARNAGWNESQYEYIAFLDADDSWHPSKLSLQYEWMCDRPDVFLSGHETNTPNSKKGINHGFRAEVISSARLLLSNCFSTPTIMLKKELPLRFDENQRYCEDYKLWLTASLRGYSTYKSSEHLTNLHKSKYGESGLSSDLWKMEKHELAMYMSLKNSRLISSFASYVLCCISLLKFIKRYFISKSKVTFNA